MKCRFYITLKYPYQILAEDFILAYYLSNLTGLYLYNCNTA